ncbi:DNA methyltransferase [Ferrovibrio terrae]|uniref:DNA methyltransferase n=1 Tax=Ferrovibrio terrae TaxID=2594003 RepID=UPI0031378576
MRADVDVAGPAALNAICPYFTMFPLEFPLRILKRYANEEDVVLDPFCGRGTTNYAARMQGLYSIGIDSNPVAVAATKSKLVSAEPDEIVSEARRLLSMVRQAETPSGEFWKRAYHAQTLTNICRLRKALLLGHSTRRLGAALTGIVLGALHGPMRQNGSSSYLSNQCPRTYAPKPKYAVNYWKRHKMAPPKIDVLEVIGQRAKRYYPSRDVGVQGLAVEGDSRFSSPYYGLKKSDRQASWIITSPPYYGLRTYVPDQWIRNWFLGGTDAVDYSSERQLSHAGLLAFQDDLRRVWLNSASVCAPRARLVIRFGAINDRKISSPLEVIRDSLEGTPWRIVTARSAGAASEGKRQVNTFYSGAPKAVTEIDLWAYLDT